MCLTSLSNLYEKCFKMKIKRLSETGEGWQRPSFPGKPSSLFCFSLSRGSESEDHMTVFASLLVLTTNQFNLWLVDHWDTLLFMPYVSVSSVV